MLLGLRPRTPGCILLLEGQSFTLFTDHKPLTFALFRVSSQWSARQQRHLSYLSKFTSDLVPLPSPQNVVEDALSRPSSVLSPATSALTVDMVRDPGFNPFGDFCLDLLHLAWFLLLLLSLCPPYNLCPPPHLWISQYCPPCSPPAQKLLLFLVTLLSRLSLCPMLSPL